MIGVMAFMVFAMMIVGLLLMAIAGWAIEVICSREEDCPKKGSECAECDYLAIYDGADEALRAGYYKQYRVVRDIQSERAIMNICRKRQERQRRR